MPSPYIKSFKRAYIGTNDNIGLTGATYQGLSEVVVTTPMRQRVAEPKRNIVSEINGRNQTENGRSQTENGRSQTENGRSQTENGEQTSSNSGNIRGGMGSGGH